MAETNQNGGLYAGQTWSFSIPVRDRTGNPVNLAGGSARYWLAQNAKAQMPVSTPTSPYSFTCCCDYGERLCCCPNNVLVQKTTDSGIIITQAGSLFSLLITLDPADTEYLKGRFYHEACARTAGGQEAPVTVGFLTINPSLNALA